MAAKSRTTDRTSRPAERRDATRVPLQPVPTAASRQAGQEARELDELVHHRIRLGIVSALASTASLTFNDLKALLDTTDGNLSVHARRLEEAGYITCVKTFESRRPRTEYCLAPAGRRSLQRYLAHMEALIATTRDKLDR